jgi:hypothetical protein
MLTPPYGASEAGSRKMPEPIMLPMTSVTTIQNPIFGACGRGAGDC